MSQTPSQLYRRILRIAKNDAPKSDHQPWRLWLCYNAKNLIHLYKDESDPEVIQTLIKNGYHDVKVIRKLWQTPLMHKKLDHRKYSYRVPLHITGYNSWIPGFATKHWLNNSQERIPRV